MNAAAGQDVRRSRSVVPLPVWAAVAGSAALAMAGAATGEPALHYLFKPLTTLLIAACLWRYRAAAGEGYPRRLLAGLLMSAVGDVFLMFSGDACFIAGLGAFLLAHLAYWSAFRLRLVAGRRGPIWPWLAYAAVALAMLATLWPHLPTAMRIPVVAYVAVLVAMASTATVAWRRGCGPAAGFAALGGLCFVVSDATLAFDRFVAPLPASTVVVLASYWLAQALIARSGMAVQGV